MEDPSLESPQYVIIKPVLYQSELVIHESFIVHFKTPMPNCWFRLWTRLMFGWEWRKSRQDEAP